MRPRLLAAETGADRRSPADRVLDREAIAWAVAAQAGRATAGIDDIAAYCAAQNRDTSHREVLGPQLPGAGASGVVVVDGWVIAEWGDPTRPEMAFSATKSIVSLVAGLAFDDGLLTLDRPVADTVDLPQLVEPPADRITWRHLLEQTSGWTGQLWGKPTTADAQSSRPGSAPADAAPGKGWAYNDVRVNLLCLALTVLLERSLPAVLDERIMRPLDASASWSWHGYRNSHAHVAGRDLPVVSGGAHWGGGLWINACDLALLGELYRHRGHWNDHQLVSTTWIDRTWTPSTAKPDYGLLWWLNDQHTVYPTGPATGRAARGNLGRHLLWIDPARHLTVVSRWGDQVDTLLQQLSEHIPTAKEPPEPDGPPAGG